MTLFAGIAITVASLAIFFYSLPRGGQTARFVGGRGRKDNILSRDSLCLFGLGLMLTLHRTHFIWF